MGHMERASVRDLHLKTSALIKNVAQGQTYVIESRGVPVAELRPITARRPTNKLPDREAFIRKLPAQKRHRRDSGGGSDLKGLYFDTAYIAKCYLHETDAAAVRELAGIRASLYTSSLFPSPNCLACFTATCGKER